MAGAPSSSNPLSTFQFTAIGKPPSLLNRLSDPVPAAQDAGNSPTPSPISSPKAPASSIAPPSTRKSLLESLAGIEAHDSHTMPSSEKLSRPEHDTSRTSRSSSSGTSSRQAPNGRASPASNGNPRPPPKMNGTHAPSPPTSTGELSYSARGNSGPATTSRPALSNLLPFSSLSFSALSTLSPRPVDQPSPQRDDALDGFRHALERLQADSAEYQRRAEETRLAMARQQEQATRWQTRADALIEPLSALLAQCEHRIAAANDVVAEVARLQGVIRQQEEDAAEKARNLASLEARNAELARTSEEQQRHLADRQRLAERCSAELSRTVAEKADLETKLREANARADAAERQQLTASATRERQLEAQLAEQRRVAAQEKKELLEQLQEQKRLTELEKQKYYDALMAEKHRLDSQLTAAREEQMRVQHMQGQQAQNNAGGASSSEPRASGTGSTSGHAPPSEPTVAPAVNQKPVVQAAKAPAAQVPRSSAANSAFAPTQASASNPPATNHGPSSAQTPEPRPAFPAGQQLPQHTSLAVKAELVTPNLKTNQPQSGSKPQHIPPPVETPTAKRVKPEPSTIGRNPLSASAPASLPPRPLVPLGTLKPETSTPTVDRVASSSKPDGQNSNAAPRREQSLDYVARPSASTNAPLGALSGGGTSTSAVHPTAQPSTTGYASQQQQPATSRPPSSHVAPRTTFRGTPVFVRASGVQSTEVPLPSLFNLPDLAYPPREETPALMISQVPADDPMGLGILHPDDRGIAPPQEQRSRGHTPPPAQDPPARGRVQDRNSQVPAHPPPPPAPTVWQPDHWSPPPDRPRLNRDRYEPPVRHKRTREDDESPERARRARMSPVDVSPPRNAAPLPRRASGQYERSLSPYTERQTRSRSRSPRPYSPSPRDRSYSPRRNYSPPSDRRYPRSPSPPPPSARGYGPSDIGYAPPHPHPVVPPQSEARLPQVVPAAPLVADGDVLKVHAPVAVAASAATPRAKQRDRAAVPAADAAAAGGAPQGRSPPAQEGVGKIPLLDRIGVAEDVTKSSPVKSRNAANKSVRGGGSARGTARGGSTRGAPSRGTSSRGLVPRGRGRGGNPPRGGGPSLFDRIDLSEANGS